MILIVSKEKLDPSTEDVIDWIDFYKKKFQRLNGDSLYESNGIFFELSDDGEKQLKIAGANLDASYNIGWYRRWSDNNFKEKIANFEFSNSNFRTIMETLSSDEGDCRKILFNNLNVKRWLTTPQTSYCNKVVALEGAKKFGLKIPHTILTGKKEDLKLFLSLHDKIICKDLSVPYFFFENNKRISSYTTELTTNTLEFLSESFKPSLFQELVKKNYEIRAFYIDGKFYSMAIFSQLDQQTETDFRKYNTEKPNRTVPYKLPQLIEQRLTNLMQALNLLTGSIDLIKSAQDYIFLEINPIGQFGMTSYPCNYHLDKIIAEYLISHDND